MSIMHDAPDIGATDWSPSVVARQKFILRAKRLRQSRLLRDLAQVEVEIDTIQRLLDEVEAVPA